MELGGDGRCAAPRYRTYWDKLTQTGGSENHPETVRIEQPTLFQPVL